MSPKPTSLPPDSSSTAADLAVAMSQPLGRPTGLAATDAQRLPMVYGSNTFHRDAHLMDYIKVLYRRRGPLGRRFSSWC